MAQTGVQLDRDTFSCSICLDLMRDPVAVPCGHSFCMSCIHAHWDKEDEEGVYSCPQCRKTVTARPVLVPNAMLAVIVEELKKTRPQASHEDHCYAGPGDVACDVCIGRKLTARKSCLFCLISFCDKHLQPHYHAPALAKHKLVEPSVTLQKSVCPHHDEAMKMFCRTDQKSICYLCPVDDHKGHDAVSAAAERSEKQKELEEIRQKIQQRIQDREKDVKLLQQEKEALDRGADKAVEDSEKIFAELIGLIEKKSSDVKQRVRSQQETEVSQVKELQEKLEQEIAELKRKDAELQELSKTEDHNQFLQDFHQLSELTHWSNISIRPLRYFQDVAAAVSRVRSKVEDNLREEWTNISQTVADVDVLLSQPEHMTRAKLKNFSRDITLDPGTANEWLCLTDGNRKATFMCKHRSHSVFDEEYSYYCQVLSAEALSGRCYWEVEWTGFGVSVVVAQKKFDGAASLLLNESGYGNDDRSWVMYCNKNSYNFWHNNAQTPISGPESSRVGVYVDHSEGILSFYSVSETVTHLHTVQTTFTEPLHAGVRFDYFIGSTAEFCKLKQTD